MSALEDFNVRVGEIESLLDEISPGWWPSRQTPQDVGRPALSTPVRVVARASLVLLVSYFEGFLKDLTDEAFDEILDSRSPCNSLGSEFRGQVVASHVRVLRASERPADVWDALQALTRLGTLLSNSAPITAEMLPRQEVKRAVTSIEPKKINMLLKALNDDDLKAGPMSRHGARLLGLKQLRDNAVHGNESDLPPLGYGDVRDTLELLRACAEDMQARVETLLAAFR